jgi:hypothetical protein
MSLNFKKWLESIDYDSQVVIVEKGEILYHGTLESYDMRKIRPGGYDKVFWTTDSLYIAQSYIPRNGSYSNMSTQHILDEPKYFQSLGISDKIIRKAWEIHKRGLEKLRHADEIMKQFDKIYREKEARNDFEYKDDFFSNWEKAENDYKKYQQEWRVHDDILSAFVYRKMTALGYKPDGRVHKTFTRWDRVLTDKNGKILPASHKSIGQVLRLECQRDFKMFNMAYRKEGDLTDVDYNKINTFRKIEEEEYDGVVINDFAQILNKGNVGHLSVGFFQHALQDLKVTKIRNQTHPEDEDD